MDWSGWALFGLIATAALTAVMITAQLIGLTRLDLPLLLGTLVTENPDRAHVAGFFIHLGIGEGFALGYAGTFALLDAATWWLGALLGLLQAAVALTVLVPLMAGVHPRIASSRAGPRPPPCSNLLGCSASITAFRPRSWSSLPISSTASRSACS